MGVYHEPRVPQGAPTDGERDVWLDDGKVKFGHWSSATSQWVVDKESAYNDSWEPAFSKNTGFNKNIGSESGTVAEGNHTHGGTFSGDADTVDGKHASEFIQASSGAWREVGASGEPSFGPRYSADGTDTLHKLWFRIKNGFVSVQGMIKRTSSSDSDISLFTLPTGYRPSQDIIGGPAVANVVFGSPAGRFPCHVTVSSGGQVILYNAPLYTNDQAWIAFTFQL